MDPLKQLRQKREAAHTTAKGLAEAAGANLMTAEQKTAFDAAVAERAAYDTQIEALVALQEADRTSTAVAGASAGKNLAEDKPWGNVGEQLFAIKNHKTGAHGRVDARIQAALGQSESVDSDGGFALAPEFSKNLIESTYEVGQIAGRCFELPMAGKTLTMPAIDEKSRANGSRWGGIQGYWANEAATLTASKAKLKQVTLTASKLTALVYDTNEASEDIPALSAYVQRVAPDELAFKLDDAVLNGLGAGQPLGVLNSGALITVAKDAAQPTATISTTNVLNMRGRMPASSRATAVWYVTQDLESQLLNLTRGSGTAVEFLYKAPGERGNNNAFGMMLGSPVIVIEQAAQLGSVGDIVYVDPQMYYLGRRGGLRTDSSIHVAFLTDELAYRFILRADGQPIWQQARAQANGGNTLSPFVTLAARP